jgi:hypothetical protein
MAVAFIVADFRQKYFQTAASLTTFARSIFAGQAPELASRTAPSQRTCVRAWEEPPRPLGSSAVLVSACCGFWTGLLGLLTRSAPVAGFAAGLAAREAGGLRRTWGRHAEQGAALNGCKRAHRCNFSAKLVPDCA